MKYIACAPGYSCLFVLVYYLAVSALGGHLDPRLYAGMLISLFVPGVLYGRFFRDATSDIAIGIALGTFPLVSAGLLGFLMGPEGWGYSVLSMFVNPLGLVHVFGLVYLGFNLMRAARKYLVRKTAAEV